jgi:hypothetical protein
MLCLDWNDKAITTSSLLGETLFKYKPINSTSRVNCLSVIAHKTRVCGYNKTSDICLQLAKPICYNHRHSNRYVPIDSTGFHTSVFDILDSDQTETNDNNCEQQ